MRSLVIGGALGVGLAGCYAVELGEIAEPTSMRSLPEMTPTVPTVPEVEAGAEVAEVPTEPEPEGALEVTELRVAASPVEGKQLALWVSDDDGSSWLRVLAGKGRMWQAVLDDGGGANLLAVDAAGRPLLRDETGIVRRELDGSWTTLRPTGG